MKTTEIKELAKELVYDYFDLPLEEWRGKWFRGQKLTGASGELMGNLADAFMMYKQGEYTKEETQSLCDGYIADYEKRLSHD